MTTIGSLFTGYGGLDMGVAMALDPDARVLWTSDIEPGPRKLATVRWPNTPNLGDITRINWNNVEPVDILCGGSPCQDLSFAGRRAGMELGTRSSLWASMTAAIKTIRPRLIVWENVQGALSARANSSMESRPGILGNEPARPTLRAAGRVVGDLATLGYDACWRVVRASDAGAPHQRARLFVIAYPNGEPWDMWRATGPSEATRGWPLSLPARPDISPITMNSTPLALLPTPQATNAPRSSTGYGPNLHEVATGSDLSRFGPYAGAIARWENVTGRTVPNPTTPARRAGGKMRLSTRFVEWLMGLPDGHVTGNDIALPREQQLRLLGNGVVPQQAALAVSRLMETALRFEASVDGNAATCV